MPYIGNQPLVKRFLVGTGGSTATPNANSVAYYAKVDGKLYWKNSSGTEYPFGGSGGGGSAYFNSSLNSIVGYTTTNTLTTCGLGVGASQRAVVYSIHVTNIAGVDDSITSDIQFNGGSTINLAYNVPVPASSSVELLKRPKVMNTSDLLRFKSAVSGYLTVAVTYDLDADTTYYGNGLIVNSTSVMTAYTAGSNSTVDSLMVTNVDGTNSTSVRVSWTNGADTLQAYYAYDMLIPAKATVELMEGPKRLPSGHKIKIQAVDANRCHLVWAGRNSIA